MGRKRTMAGAINFRLCKDGHCGFDTRMICVQHYMYITCTLHVHYNLRVHAKRVYSIMLNDVVENIQRRRHTELKLKNR